MNSIFGAFPVFVRASTDAIPADNAAEVVEVSPRLPSLLEMVIAAEGNLEKVSSKGPAMKHTAFSTGRHRSGRSIDGKRGKKDGAGGSSLSPTPSSEEDDDKEEGEGGFSTKKSRKHHRHASRDTGSLPFTASVACLVTRTSWTPSLSSMEHFLSATEVLLPWLHLQGIHGAIGGTTLAWDSSLHAMLRAPQALEEEDEEDGTHTSPWLLPPPLFCLGDLRLPAIVEKCVARKLREGERGGRGGPVSVPHAMSERDHRYRGERGGRGRGGSRGGGRGRSEPGYGMDTLFYTSPYSSVFSMPYVSFDEERWRHLRLETLKTLIQLPPPPVPVVHTDTPAPTEDVEPPPPHATTTENEMKWEGPVHEEGEGETSTREPVPHKEVLEEGPPFLSSPASVPLRGLQHVALSSMLLGYHTMMEGPVHSGKRIAAYLGLTCRLLALAATSSTLSTEASITNMDSNPSSSSFTAPQALFLFACFADILRYARWVRDVCGKQAFLLLHYAPEKSSASSSRNRHGAREEMEDGATSTPLPYYHSFGFSPLLLPEDETEENMFSHGAWNAEDCMGSGEEKVAEPSTWPAGLASSSYTPPSISELMRLLTVAPSSLGSSFGEQANHKGLPTSATATTAAVVGEVVQRDDTIQDPNKVQELLSLVLGKEKINEAGTTSGLTSSVPLSPAATPDERGEGQQEKLGNEAEKDRRRRKRERYSSERASRGHHRHHHSHRHHRRTSHRLKERDNRDGTRHDHHHHRRKRKDDSPVGSTSSCSRSSTPSWGGYSSRSLHRHSHQHRRDPHRHHHRRPSHRSRHSHRHRHRSSLSPSYSRSVSARATKESKHRSHRRRAHEEDTSRTTSHKHHHRSHRPRPTKEEEVTRSEKETTSTISSPEREVSLHHETKEATSAMEEYPTKLHEGTAERVPDNTMDTSMMMQPEASSGTFAIHNPVSPESLLPSSATLSSTSSPSVAPVCTLPSYLCQRIPILLLTYAQLTALFRSHQENDDDDDEREGGEADTERMHSTETKEAQSSSSFSPPIHKKKRRFTSLPMASSLLLPIEHVQLCAFFDIDRAVRPPPPIEENALPPSCWTSLVNTLDVACQMVWTTRGGCSGGGGRGVAATAAVPGEETYEWVVQTLLPNVGEREVWAWKLEDQTVRPLLHLPMELALVSLPPRRRAGPSSAYGSGGGEEGQGLQASRKMANEVEIAKITQTAGRIVEYYRTRTAMEREVVSEETSSRAQWEGPAVLVCCSSRREQESMCQQLQRVLQESGGEERKSYSTSDTSGGDSLRISSSSSSLSFMPLLRVTTSLPGFLRGEAEIVVVCDSQLAHLASSSSSSSCVVPLLSTERRVEWLLIHFSLPKGLLQRDPMEVRTFLQGRARVLLGDPGRVCYRCLSEWKRKKGIEKSEMYPLPQEEAEDKGHRMDLMHPEEVAALHSTELLPFSLEATGSSRLRVCVVLADFQLRGAVGQRLHEVLFEEH